MGKTAGETLADKVALVTGASRGIGSAIARELAAEGAHLVLTARSEKALHDLASALGDCAQDTIAVVADVGSYAAMETVVEQAKARFGRLDILINNAGTIEPIAPIAEGDPAQWARLIEVNLVGAYNAARAALGALTAQSDSVIVNISSGAALRPMEAWSAYCTSKSGLAMLTRALDLELGPQGVRVYGFQPGNGGNRYASQNPGGRFSRRLQK